MSDFNKLEAAQRLMRVALGSEYPDGEIVTNMGVGFSEPGYATDAPWILGDWNTVIGSRLFDAFERLGIEAEWLDEWTDCQECHKLVRTQPDSYGWKRSYAYIGDAGDVCHECLVNLYGEDALEDFINEPSKAVTWASGALLEGYGYTRLNEDEYENGLHPGQNDNPAKILKLILEDRPEAQVVFLIDDVGQFDIRFSAYVKETNEPEGS